MTRSLQANLQHTRRSDVGSETAADTTLLLEDLKRRYKRDGEPLEVNFREMVGWVRPGDQLTHQIHPYPAKLLPHIAHFFVNASVLRRESAVLDPFAGTGTVALEASLAGGVPYIADSNPLALLIAKVKTTPYDSMALLETARVLSRRIARLRTAPHIPVVNEQLWYFANTKQELERVLRGVGELDSESERDFFRVCFSVVARRLSLADPSISVPVRLAVKERFDDSANKAVRKHLKWLKAASALAEFDNAVQSNIARVAAANRAFPHRKEAVVVGNDARALSLGDRTLPAESIHLSITSPPYGSAQKYIRASSLALNWLSLCEPRGLAELEGKSIGREHLPSRQKQVEMREQRYSAPLAADLLAIRETNPHRADITATYLAELEQALREIVRVTAPGGHTVIVVGNNTVTGRVLRNDEFIATAMRQLGLELELELKDRIHSRGLLTTRHSTAGVINGETIMLFRKPTP